MPSASPISTQPVGRTFAIAIGVLGIVALVQLGGVSWVFVHRFESLAAKAVAPKQKVAAPRTVATANPAGEDDEEKITPADPFAEQVESTKGADSTDPILPPSKPEPVSQAKLNPPPGPPQNRYQELMQQGKALRLRGDMNTALTRFREAAALDTTNAANAETIAEIAMTYEHMSLLDKAAEQWKRIYDMGEAAGTYYIAAESRLKMSQAQAVAQAAQSTPQDSTPVSSLRADAVLGLGEIAREDRPDNSAALKFALKVPVKAKRGVKINVQDVDILVLFYDQLDAKTIVQTAADVSYDFTSRPIDWADNEPETLEVVYKQPAVLAADIKKGPHKYHGYIVRVYYKGELQDTHSEPETLNAKFPAPQTLDTTANPK